MTLFMDKFMSRFITVGGLSVILAVLLILVFIGKEVVPLLQEAKVSKVETIELPKVDVQAITVDEWTTLPGLVSKDSIYFIDFQDNKKIIREELRIIEQWLKVHCERQSAILVQVGERKAAWTKEKELLGALANIVHNLSLFVVEYKTLKIYLIRKC